MSLRLSSDGIGMCVYPRDVCCVTRFPILLVRVEYRACLPQTLRERGLLRFLIFTLQLNAFLKLKFLRKPWLKKKDSLLKKDCLLQFLKQWKSCDTKVYNQM